MASTTFGQNKHHDGDDESLERLCQGLDDLLSEMGLDDQSPVVRPNAHMATDAEQQVEELTQKLVDAFESNEVISFTSKEKSTFGNCSHCGNLIETEASIVGQKNYHPNCFVCDHCERPLGEEQYFIINGKNICADDRNRYLETCVKCGEIIEGEVVRPKKSAEPHHAHCFMCCQCAKPVVGKYFELEGDLIICEKDYLASRAPCDRCSEKIVDTILNALGKVFHPECFKCEKCGKSLQGETFFRTDDESDQVYCKEDYGEFFAKKCDHCKAAILDDCLINSKGVHLHKSCAKNEA